MYELIIREKNTTTKKPINVNKGKDVMKLLKPISDCPTEHGIVICLDGHNRVIHTQVLAIGTKTSGDIDLQQVLKVVLINDSTSFVFAHNHPSGKVRPSKADKKLYKILYKAGLKIGVPCINSLIVSKDKAYDMEHGTTYCKR